MDLRYKLKIAPTSYPASVADIKRNLRIPTSDTDTDRDALIQDLIYDAITASQNATGRQYCPVTYTLYLDSYPSDGLVEITLGPVYEISSVKYWAPDAIAIADLSEGLYELDNSELTARLHFLEEFETDPEKLNAIEIEFVAGFTANGNQAADIPADLKQAVILRACEAFLNPGNVSQDSTRIKAAEIRERDYKVQRY
jgi:uncharacterized phiE125 gp8 family phage protein